jgi:hypothetical protein
VKNLILIILKEDTRVKGIWEIIIKHGKAILPGASVSLPALVIRPETTNPE